MTTGYLFPTQIGTMGLAWQGERLITSQLPMGNERQCAKFLVEYSGADLTRTPPKWIEKWAERIQLHLGGKYQNFSDAPLHWETVPQFHQKVYLHAQKIPVGRVVSYGELAQTLKNPLAARAVGQALRRNPFPILVPCHRIVGQNNSLGGFMGKDGIHLKSRILQIEKANFARPRLAWDPDRAIQILSAQDKRVKSLIERIGPYNLMLFDHATPFETLFRSIVYQQLTGQVAKTILTRTLAIYQGQFPSPEEFLATKMELLRAAGLSGSKIRYLKDLAENVLDGIVPPRFSALNKLADEEIIERLTAVHGVGRWTVEMLLIFRLGRPDVFPVGDYAVRKAYSEIFCAGQMAPVGKMQKYAERWQPYRSIVSWYLWRHLDTLN